MTPDTEKCCENGSFKEPHECLKCLPDTEDELEDLWLGYSFLHTPDNLPQSKELFKDFTQILTSHTTYWKERVRKEVEGMKKDEVKWKKAKYDVKSVEAVIWNRALDTLLDNLK